MDSIISQVKDLAGKADEHGRDQLLIALRDLQYSIETPKDTFMRVYNAHLQVAVAYVGSQLGVFRELASEKGGVLTTAELAERSSASPDLLERILRYLSAIGFMVNDAPDQFQANNITYVLADAVADAGLIHAFDTCGPAVQALPSFLADTKFQDITVNNKTPFQKGFNTELTCFQWVTQQPKEFAAFQKVMTAMQSSDWLSDFELFDKAALSVVPDTMQKQFFVDVGGGHGHQSIQVLKKYPNLYSRVFLQDLPEAVDHLPPIDGVEIVAQDFFKPQVVKGASFYYLRRILHDWPDNQCVEILQQLAAVMTKDSRILIDEVVLPDSKTHWNAAMQDISMMILFAGKERTKKQWESLVKESGLRIAEIHTYNISLYNSITVLEQQ